MKCRRACFGSALNLNVHLHMLFLDGAYRFSTSRPAFHRAHQPAGEELNDLLDTLHGVFAPNFKHRERIVPQRAQRTLEGDKPVAPMSWPLPHIHVLRGTWTPVQWMQRLKRVFAMPQGTLS